MKALEILTKLYNTSGLGLELFEYGINLKDVNEAIKELKQLQNRSCEGCKYNKEIDGFMVFCDKEMCQDGSKMMWHPYTKDYYCKYWEAKQ